MRSIYKTLLKLKEQEKRERHIQFAEAEAQRQRQEEQLAGMKDNLIQEQQKMPDTIGMLTLKEQTTMQRYFDIQDATQELNKQANKVERLRHRMKEAQIECKVMEKVIESIHNAEQKEIDRKLDIINDEIAVQGWRRRQ